MFSAISRISRKTKHINQVGWPLHGHRCPLCPCWVLQVHCSAPRHLAADQSASSAADTPVLRPLAVQGHLQGFPQVLWISVDSLVASNGFKWLQHILKMPRTSQKISGLGRTCPRGSPSRGSWHHTGPWFQLPGSLCSDILPWLFANIVNIPQAEQS